ncbi:MAG: HEAT repeat domain-containing protein [Candidatus Latescibacteria bacterium]|jgi:HEAT repeat protein|nr:HEAT repeat domain-containing protein [Candidatus Latescibacterota bacterium]
MNGKKVFVFCCITLVCMGCSKSTDDLIKDLYSDSPSIRFQGALALERKNDDRDVKEVVEKVIDVLDDENEQAVFIATQVLGSLKDPMAVESLGKMVSHQNLNIRAKACWSLGNIKDGSALPHLLKGLKDPEGDVRFAAVFALGLLEYLPALEHIYPMSRDSVDSVRVAVIQSLYRYRDVKGSNVSASDFAALITDKNDRVRYVAVQALGGKLEEVRKWESTDRKIAGEMLIEALEDNNIFVRFEAIKSLGMIKYKEAIPALKRIRETSSIDEEVKIDQAIKKILEEASL